MPRDKRKTFTFDGQRREVTGKDDTEIAVKMAMKIRDLEEGKTKVTKHMLVKDWFKVFMKTYKEKSVSTETYSDWESRANSKILPLIGHKQLKDVKPIDCQNIVYSMDGSSKTYIRKVINTMETMFDKALKNGLILTNPALSDDLESPEAEDGTHRALTDTERKYTYIVAEYHRAGLWVLTMLLTGMRPSETGALQGRHLDFKRETIIIEHAVKKKDKRIGKTKTESGTRLVPMPEELINKYKALKLGPFDYVFTNTNGVRLSKGNMRTMWKSFKREMNIAMGCMVYRNQIVPPYRVAEDFVPYCCRHDFCTSLEAAGVPINEAARLMGHKNISVTSRIYTHYSQDSFDRVADQMKAYRRKKSEAESAKNQEAESSSSVETGVEHTS